MINPVNSAIASTIIIFSFIIIFIFAAIDGGLSIIWKIILCSLCVLLIWAGFKGYSEESKKSKEFIDNREDLR